MDKMLARTAIFPALSRGDHERRGTERQRAQISQKGRHHLAAVRAAVSGGKLKGNEALPAKVVLTVEGINLSVEIEGAIELE